MPPRSITLPVGAINEQVGVSTSNKNNDTKDRVTDDAGISFLSSSSSTTSSDELNAQTDWYVIISVLVLQGIIKEVLCPKCKNKNVSFSIGNEQKHGFAQSLKLQLVPLVNRSIHSILVRL